MLSFFAANPIYPSANGKVCAAQVRRLAFMLAACSAVGACKPSETDIRKYLPRQFSEAKIEESVRFPFLCTTALFSAPFGKNDVAKIPGIKTGPIYMNTSDNSVIYRIIKRAERGCAITDSGNGKINPPSYYLEAEEVYFLEPAIGKLVIFDLKNSIILFVEA